MCWLFLVCFFLTFYDGKMGEDGADGWVVAARSKTLTKFAMDWQDLLRKASAAGDD